MTSSRPYLIRAYYDWITDNSLTPHLLVNAELEGVVVPEQHIHEGRIVLNVNPTAVEGLQLSNDWIEFRARFGGVVHHVSLPPAAVLAVYARENGQGMVFVEEPETDTPPDSTPPKKSSTASKRPQLKVVK